MAIDSLVPAGASPAPAGTAVPSSGDLGGSYADLKRLIVAEGLLDPQPGYYLRKLTGTGLLLGAGIAIMLLSSNFIIQLLNGIYLALVLAQIAFLAHDAGHHQIIRRGLSYQVLTLTLGNFLLGVSAHWWTDKHNAHHSHPNQDDMDPDIDIPVIAFNEEQALAMHGPMRWFGAHQAYLIVPLLCFQAMSMRVMGTLYVIKNNGRVAIIEVALMLAQLALYFFLLLHRLSVVEAIAVFALTQALFGIYLAAAFAPNHKGMPVVERDSPLDFLHRQVLTARNVYGHPITDFALGGLNYQIEHHLFPSIPRNRLKRSQLVIRQFCCEHGISYHETNLGSSYGEVFAHLQRMSRIVRREAPEPA